MILIANDADFSQNNLGQIDLPYSELTLAVIDKFTKVLTDPQKKALNTLLTKVEKSGILAKQKHFYLPILAGTLNESFINIADPLLPTEVTPNASYYSLSSGGIFNDNPNTADAARLLLTLKSGMATNDFHVLQFPTENITAATDALWIYGGGVAYTPLSISYDSAHLIPASNFNLMNISPNLYNRIAVGADYILNIGLSKSLKGFSFLDVTKLKAYSPNESEVTLTSSYPIIEMAGDVNLSGYNNSAMLRTQGLITIGKGLTADEIIILSNASNNLMTAMGVTL